MAATQVIEPTGKVYSLCVRYAEAVSLTSADVQDVLRQASQFLSHQTAPACKTVSLKSDGTVAKSSGPDTLSEPADFDKLTANGCVNVVERINWCGKGLDPTAQIKGCAPLGGKGLVVIRGFHVPPDSEDRAYEPITWLHELGHTSGIEHNAGALSDVMYAFIGAPTKTVTPKECAAYVTPVQGNGGAFGAQAAPPAPPPAGASIEEFIRRLPRGGFPVSEAVKYQNPDDLKAALKLLSNPDFIDYRPKIIALLGVIGSEDTIPVLANILRTPFGSRPQETDIYVRFASAIAIGAIANRKKLTPDKFVVLKEGLDSTFWWPRVTPSIAPIPQAMDSNLPANGPQTRPTALSTRSATALVGDLVSQTYRGYALTGSPAVAEDLERRSHIPQAAIPVGDPEAARLITNEPGRIKSARELLQKSASQGALSLYQ